MKNSLKISDVIYHPCSLDIIKHKITGIRTYEDHTVIEAKSVDNVGACGRISILLTVDDRGDIRFTGLLEESEYDSGLGDFVEGMYYMNETEARLAYYTNILSTCHSNLRERERLYHETVKRYDQVKALVTDLKIEINKNRELKNTTSCEDGK